MQNEYVGVRSTGLKCPLIKEGDDIVKIVVDTVTEATKTYVNNKMDTYNQKDFYYTWDLHDNDIVGVTESVLARAQGNYASMKDIAVDIKQKYGQESELIIFYPIFSRNRFAEILKGIARAVKKVYIIMGDKDEVGNVRRNHPFTGLYYDELYKEICRKEGCEVEINPDIMTDILVERVKNVLICNLHHWKDYKKDFNNKYEYLVNKGLKVYTLADICSNKCEYGLLGSNKSSDEKLKLFPHSATDFCMEVKRRIKNITGVDVIVCVYGDGCFKDPYGEIWEFADPETMPGFTDQDLMLEPPVEVKLKYCIDNVDSYRTESNKNLTDDELVKKVLNATTVFKPADTDIKRQGTTPRIRKDLIASLMDLTSGSGDKGTPIVLVQNYFKNYIS